MRVMAKVRVTLGLKLELERRCLQQRRSSFAIAQTRACERSGKRSAAGQKYYLSEASGERWSEFSGARGAG